MLCINAPSIGFSIPKIANVIAIMFNVNANPILLLIVFIVFLDISIK